jgi:hypothetical protein
MLAMKKTLYFVAYLSYLSNDNWHSHQNNWGLEYAFRFE